MLHSSVGMGAKASSLAIACQSFFFSCIRNNEPIHTMPPRTEIGQLNQPGINSMDADTTNGVTNTYIRVISLSFIASTIPGKKPFVYLSDQG